MRFTLDAVTRTVGGDVHLYPTHLTLDPGLHVLLGPTGAGKTTLLRLLAGLDRPTTGRLFKDDQDLTGRKPQQRNVAFVYQQFINYPSLTVFENIASPLRVRGGLSRDQIRQRVEAVAEQLHITPLLNRLPAALSGGQKQRTALGRALVKEADLLLLDEPLVNLDYKLRETLRAELRLVLDTDRQVVVYATTEPREALMMGGQVAVLDEGRLLQHGPATVVYHRPHTRRVAERMSDPPLNLFAAERHPDHLRVSAHVRLPIPEHLAALPLGPLHLGLRPAHVHLRAPDAATPPLPCRVTLTEHDGSETILHAVHEAASAPIPLLALEPGLHEHDEESVVDLFLDTRYLFAFDLQDRCIAAPAARRSS